MRCPTCNALNPDSAEWCTQCFTSLRAPEPVVDVPPDPQPEATPQPDVGDVPPASTDADAAPQLVQRGNATFRKTAEGLDWQCGRCDTFNPIEVQRCTTCGYGFGDTVRGPQEADVPDVDENVALLASAVLPGAGHVLAGRTATGVARGVIFLLFVVGGWLLLREAGATGQGPLPAVPLLLGALVIWVTTAFDAVLAARGEQRQLLEGRVFFWLVVGVLGLLMAAFAVAALSVTAA